LEFAAQAAQAYAGLIASPYADPESGLGGRLFCAGELDGACRACVVAANIAGAATFCATADRAAQKQALRDGVADFLVNSLDEALRILKNQLRKREPVALCVALEPAAMEREMHERGVAPDLFRRDLPLNTLHQAFLCQEGEYDETDLRGIPAIVVWRVDSGSPLELAKLDEIALQCLDTEEWASRRWLQLSPRYLGRLAQGLHVLSTHREFDARFAEQLRVIAVRELTFGFEVRSYVRGLEGRQTFAPAKH